MSSWGYYAVTGQEVIDQLARDPSVAGSLRVASKFPSYDPNEAFVPWYTIALVKIVRDHLNPTEQEQVYTFLQLKGYNTQHILGYLS